MAHKTLTNVSILLLLFMGIGCKQSTSPNTSSNPSGTILFSTGGAEIADEVLSSNASTNLFHGFDPSFASGGRIIYDANGSYTANGREQILISSPDGTNAQSILDLQTSFAAVPIHPRMSPDGRYISFNYGDILGTTLGTHFGTLIYSSSGTVLYYIDSLWDAAWAPDGSLVLSASITNYDGSVSTYISAGLYKVDKNFTSITPIGSGLTLPQSPSVSHDGNKIAFEMNAHIWVIGMDGSGLKQLTNGPNSEMYSVWSPDDNELAAVSYGDVGVSAGNSLAIVSANAATTVSPSASVWVRDNNNGGLLNPTGVIDWK